MGYRVDRLNVEMSRTARERLGIRDTLAFVEDGDFLTEFYECGLDDEDRQKIETVITVCPTGGEVVPVSDNIRDIIYDVSGANSVVIRYVYLKPSTVLLVSAYSGHESHSLTEEEAREAEMYIAHQLEYFSSRHTR